MTHVCALNGSISHQTGETLQKKVFDIIIGSERIIGDSILYVHNCCQDDVSFVILWLHTRRMNSVVNFPYTPRCLIVRSPDVSLPWGKVAQALEVLNILRVLYVHNYCQFDFNFVILWRHTHLMDSVVNFQYTRYLIVRSLKYRSPKERLLKHRRYSVLMRKVKGFSTAKLYMIIYVHKYCVA